MCLQQKCQPKGPPLIPLSEEQTLQHLWSGETSIARRFFKSFLKATLPAEVKKKNDLCSSEMERLGQKLDGRHPEIAKMCHLLCQDVQDLSTARQHLLSIEKLLRVLDSASGVTSTSNDHLALSHQYLGGLHKAAADVLYLYANTQIFFQPGYHYKGTSHRDRR